MAHQITSTDRVVLAKTGAWHGKGEIFAEALTGEQVITNAFPWEPICRKSYYRTDSPTSPLVEATDKKIILRSDNHAYLGTVGVGFGVIGNADLVRMIETALPGARYETAGTLFGGRRVWALANLGGFTLPKGDENKQYLMIANGHDGSFRAFMGETNTRVVCNNTLTSAIFGGEGETNEGINAYRHTKNVKARVFDAAKGIAKARDRAAEFASTAKKLTQVAISEKQAKEFFLDLFPAPKAKGKAVETTGLLDAVLEATDSGDELMGELLAGSERAMARHAKLLETMIGIYASPTNAGGFGENLWTALNTVTEYVDHHRSTRGTDDDDRADNRFASVVWGSGNQIKQQAYKAAVALAN